MEYTIFNSIPEWSWCKEYLKKIKENINKVYQIIYIALKTNIYGQFQTLIKKTLTSDTEPSDSNCTWCAFEYESVKASQQAPLHSTKYRLKPAYFQGQLGKNYVWFLFAMPNANGPTNVTPKQKTTDILNAPKIIKILRVTI